MPAKELPTKTCASCGRGFAWRKKWARTWEQVRYCSDGCRRQGVRDLDLDLERAILELLSNRPAEGSLCPSEAARRVAGTDWREFMERARSAARRLEARGQIEITQGGVRVDSDRARGPIRLRRTRPG